MSLKQLLNWHYFTVQTNEHAINQDGAIDRKGGWISKYENLKGHLQSVEGKRSDEVLDYAIKELEIKYILFHNHTNVFIKNINSYRILTWINPKIKIENYQDLDNIRIFKIISLKEPVALRGRKTIFEVYLEEVLRSRQSI
jgi:hypothetical protein